MVMGCSFFKTRSIAKAAIEGGKVHHNNERVKVSKEIRVGMELIIQQGFDKNRCSKSAFQHTWSSTSCPATL